MSTVNSSSKEYFFGQMLVFCGNLIISFNEFVEIEGCLKSILSCSADFCAYVVFRLYAIIFLWMILY
jgi:hypothetical protein